MIQEVVLDLVRNALMTVLSVAAPPLIMGLSVGILVSIFQAVTSIQEQTMAFIPKIVAVMLSLLIFGPFMITTMQQFVIDLYTSIPGLIVPSF